MNRTGLVFALAIGAGVGVVFAVWPQLDVAISRPFFNEAYRVFPVQYSLVARHLRDLFTYAIAALAAPAFIALAIKLVLPRRRMLMSARAALFLTATLALAPGLMANVILKDNWGRPRPAEVTEFHGPEQFRPWWDPRGPCERNCSFVAGEGAGGFWTLAPAALAPPPLRPLAYAAAFAFATAAGLLRLSGGAHFFTDVVFSGVFTFLIIWVVHGLIYRWPRTRLTDEQVERAIEYVVLPVYEPVERWFARLRGRRAS
ncbi:MAG: phosphatase PAP2 family protein [Alphaproteobacteria bacterium]